MGAMSVTIFQSLYDRGSSVHARSRTCDGVNVGIDTVLLMLLT